MSGRILCYSDLHFSERNMADLSEVCRWIGQEIEEREPALVVNLGDTVHSHGTMTLPLIDHVVRGIGVIASACGELNIQHVVLLGNHDQYDRDARYTIAPLFWRHPKTAVVGNVQAIGRYGFISYMRDHKKWDEAFSEVEGQELIFVHQEIEGAAQDNGMEETRGVSPPRRAIFNGHYHISQILPSGVTCVGSTVYHSFADRLEPRRGLYVIDLDVAGWDVTRVPCPVGPIYHTVRAEDLGSLSAALPESEWKRLHLRIGVSSCEEEEAAREWTGRVAELVIRRQVEELPETREVTDLSEHLNPLGVVAEYVAKAETQLDKERLRRVGGKLVEEAKRT